MQNHFELFGLSAAFGLNTEVLERSYREISRACIRTGSRTPGPRAAPLQWTTRVERPFKAWKTP